MFLARNFPGLPAILEWTDSVAPEATRTLAEAGDKLLEGEAKERIAHTKVIARAAGMKLR